MNNVSKRRGFTLVELMVVVAVMGVLVAMAIPAYNNATAGAEAAVCNANARTYDSAMMMWMMQDPVNNTDPTDTDARAAIDTFMKGGAATCPTNGEDYVFEETTGANGRAEYYAICQDDNLDHGDTQRTAAGIAGGGTDEGGEVTP